MQHQKHQLHKFCRHAGPKAAGRSKIEKLQNGAAEKLQNGAAAAASFSSFYPTNMKKNQKL